MYDLKKDENIRTSSTHLILYVEILNLEITWNTVKHIKSYLLQMVWFLIKKGTGSVLLFHAEVDISKEDDLQKFDPTKYKTFLDSRPPAMENEAINMVIELCRESGKQFLYKLNYA